MNILDINSSYAIIDTADINKLISLVYSFGYNYDIIYKNNINNESLIVYKDDKSDLTGDILKIMEFLGITDVLIKNIKESSLNRIFLNGKKNKVNIINGISNESFYFTNNIYFHIEDIKNYWKPSDLTQLKKGMIVEILNNNKWIKREIINPVEEWNSIYMLFNKYNKLRIESI